MNLGSRRCKQKHLHGNAMNCSDGNLVFGAEDISEIY